MSNSNKTKQSTRIRIRPFTGVMNEQYVSTIWILLKNAIQEIQKKNNSGLSFEELYRNAYTMVLHKHGEKLYSGLRDVVSDHLNTKVREDILFSLEASMEFLVTLKEAWDDHVIAMVMIRDILMYMDRVYVQQVQGLECVYNLGLILFRDKIIRSPPIRETLRSALISTITQDRNGENIDRLTIKNICCMMISVSINNSSVYEEDFESPFLQASSEYYHDKSIQLLETQDVCFYLEQTERMLIQEDERASQILHCNTKDRLLHVIENEMLSKHIKDILDIPSSGIENMLEFGKFEDIARAYRLFKRVPNGLESLADHIRSFLIKHGRTFFDFVSWKCLNTDRTKVSLEIIENLLKLRKNYDNLLEESFNNDNLLKSKISSAFESIINSGHIGPECLAIFFDYHLKRGSKSIGEIETQSIIDEVMVLFRYLQEKDAFERYYKHYLSRRLLTGRSLSEDREKIVLAKLKTECGSNFTGKLEGMFKDMYASTILNDTFKQKHVLLPIDFNCRVLTTGYWPQLPQDSSINIPVNASNVFEQFKEFYLTKHSGRQLKIVHYYSTFELYFLPQNEAARKHIVLTNPSQMIILFAFNFADNYDLQNLIEYTGLEEQECKGCLDTLLSPISGSHLMTLQNGIYSINDNFSTRQIRLKLNQSRKTNTYPSEKQQTELQQRIMEDRRHEIDACIVRAMKSRRHMRHVQLVQEVTDQLKNRFYPDMSILKRRIENLIERDFIMRDLTDRKMYTYIA